MKPLKLNIQFFADDHSIGVEFNVNISKAKEALKVLKREVDENRSIWERYKIETEGWEETANGLSGGIEKLTDVQKKQAEVVENLKKQYELVKDRLGENDSWTRGLAASYEDSRKKLSKTTAEIKQYEEQLNKVVNGTKTADEEIKELGDEIVVLSNEIKKGKIAWEDYADETKDWDKTADGLQKKIDNLTEKQKKQEEILEKLNKQLEIAEEYYGENSKEASNYSVKIEELKRELGKTSNELKDYDDKLKEAKDGTVYLEDASDDLKGKFTVLKGVISQLIADGIKKLASTAVDAAKQMVDAGISFESAFAGVRKTVDATEEEFAQLRSDILEMSTDVASSADSIAEVMEMAGQLGIKKDALTDFTKTMIMLGDSTNLSAGEAAETLARFQNITGMSQKDFDKLGSTLVDLGKICCPA